MRYVLRKAVIGNVPEIGISESEYLEFQKARNTLSNALEIEEKYEIVISNYLDFEQEILNATTKYNTVIKEMVHEKERDPIGREYNRFNMLRDSVATVREGTGNNSG